MAKGASATSFEDVEISIPTLTFYHWFTRDSSGYNNLIVTIIVEISHCNSHRKLIQVWTDPVRLIGLTIKGIYPSRTRTTGTNQYFQIIIIIYVTHGHGVICSTFKAVQGLTTIAT